MTFPFAVPIPVLTPPATRTYVGKSQGAPTAGVYNYGGPSITTVAGDILIVHHGRESTIGSSTTNVKFNGTNMTLYTPGAKLLSFINNYYGELFYAVPGAVTAGALQSNTVNAAGINLFAWILGGSLPTTPRSEIGVAQTNSNAIAINANNVSANGGLAAYGATQFGATTFTPTWGGPETVSADFAGNSATGNSQVWVGSILTNQASASRNLSLGLSATRQNIGGAISFG